MRMSYTQLQVDAPAAASFDAVLYPHRSLDPKGFRALCIFLGLASVAVGIVFINMGAWPIVGFFGLDALLLYLGFKATYRSGRLRETVRLDAEGLHVTRTHPNGKVQRWKLEPYWVQVRLDDPPQHQSQLILASHGKGLEIGTFLAPHEKGEFAQALRDALHRHRTHLPDDA